MLSVPNLSQRSILFLLSVHVTGEGENSENTHSLDREGPAPGCKKQPCV